MAMSEYYYRLLPCSGLSGPIEAKTVREARKILREKYGLKRCRFPLFKSFTRYGVKYSQEMC